uniref:RHS repeat-associated core domain-containing protein n=1 Tax=Xenorhabdus sp. PB30.3 TaxID=2788941 RepID=UPI001E3F484A|nr:RHS repeat-associated core domain-containing protein [Xenorhabdus sp. PB30.3]
MVQAGSTPAASVTADGVHLLGTDGPGSVLLSRHNDRTSRFRYTPYGQQAVADSDPALPGYNGERQDPAGGGYHLGNGYRTYNPVLMRFTAPDSLSPFGAGGLNPYAYCLGDPINRTDPSGHMSTGSIVGLVLGSIGLLAGILLAIPTGGASLTAIGAAIAGAGLAADATGIASAATADSDPQMSAVLGWVSMGLGIVSVVGGVAGLAQGMWKIGIRLEASFGKGLSGDPASSSAAYATIVRETKNVQETFNKAVNAGWIREVESSTAVHTLQLTIPKVHNISDMDYGLFNKLGFDIKKESSRIENRILIAEDRSTQFDITIKKFRELYLPFINESSKNGVRHIHKILYDIETIRTYVNLWPNQVNAYTRFTGQNAYDITEIWRNSKLSGTAHDLLRANIQINHSSLWSDSLNGADMFIFYNESLF